MNHIPHNPLYAAQQMQGMASKSRDERMALVLTGLSVAMVGMMAIREFREMFRDRDPRGHFMERGRG